MDSGNAHDALVDEKKAVVPSPAQGDRRLRIILAAVFVFLSAIGFSMIALDGSEAASGPRFDPDSTIGDFLQPGATLDTVRIKYEDAGDIVGLLNGGVIGVTDDLRLAVSVTPFPPTTFDIDLDLLLTTSDGVPIDDASITAVWDMAVMYHGPFDATFQSMGDGHYTAPFEFFMFGPWEIVTHITAPGHQDVQIVALSIYVWPE